MAFCLAAASMHPWRAANRPPTTGRFGLKLRQILTLLPANSDSARETPCLNGTMEASPRDIERHARSLIGDALQDTRVVVLSTGLLLSEPATHSRKHN
jgi:hypothetical protein